MLFSDPFRDFDALAQEIFNSRSSSRTVAMDAWQDDEKLYLEFELPGVSQDNINLEVNGSILTLTVDRPMREVVGRRLMSERSAGVFKRQLTLGDGLALDEATAALEDGILRLEIPVSEKAKPRQISISSAVKELTSD